ncbi:hypothetical protein ACFV8T_44870 [Streptomyces sp. NPDC059832]|uniref:hypothetical protein n=1 Tax=Streptomyces sp. NPDC059832 TaxID=3346966 RepID=UPI0036493306
MQNSTSRRTLSSLAAATISVTASVTLFASAIPASADGGDPPRGPRIVSDEQYAQEGNADPKSVTREGEPTLVTSDGVQQFTKLLEEVSGLESAGDASAEDYGENGTSLRIDLGVGSENSVSVTRVDAKTDIPQSVLSDTDAETAVSTLSSGSQLMTSVNPDTGAMVSTLSAKGQLTVWDSPNAKTRAALDSVVKWAEAADARDIGKIDTQPVMQTRAKPSCDSYVYTPYTNSGKVQVSGALVCNQKGAIKLSVYLEQYRGLWVWKMMVVGTAEFSGASATNANPYWKCSKGAGSQLYRGRMQTRQLTNSNGKWVGSGSVYGPEKRLTCG